MKIEALLFLLLKNEKYLGHIRTIIRAWFLISRPTLGPIRKSFFNKTRVGRKKKVEEERAIPLWKIQLQTLGKCVYCDPNFMKIPNMEDAMRGYDLPMGNPNPGKTSLVGMSSTNDVTSILVYCQAFMSQICILSFLSHFHVVTKSFIPSSRIVMSLWDD